RQLTRRKDSNRITRRAQNKLSSSWFDGKAQPRPRHLQLRRHAEVVEEKRIDVSGLLQLLGSAAGAMTGLGVDADDHRFVTGLRSLQSRGVLERVRWYDAIVVIGRRHQNRRILGAGLHVVNRRVRVESFEFGVVR